MVMWDVYIRREQPLGLAIRYPEVFVITHETTRRHKLQDRLRQVHCRKQGSAANSLTRFLYQQDTVLFRINFGIRKYGRTGCVSLYVYRYFEIYCNKFAGSVSQWKFITLTVQYTTLDYSSQLF
jgi:hypothetical protein